MNRINEKKCEGYPSPIFLEGMRKILNQMENSICRINCKDGVKGTGFFCKIPVSKKKNLEVLMTNNHIINKDYLDKENKITISIKDDKYIKSISLRDKFTYTNEEYDITIINLNDNEGENLFEFLELDENILNNDGEIYIGNSIYIIHYPFNFYGNKVAVSYGILKKTSDCEKYNFIHSCSTEYGSTGSPILNLSNNKIIGIHKQKSSGEYNIGFFLYNSIKEFIQLYNNYKMKNNYIDKNKIEEIILFMNFSAKDFKSEIIRSIFNQRLISNIIPIKYKNKIIAQKLFLNNNNLRNCMNWIPAWHGTKIENLESIIKYGLKSQGTKLPNGKIVPKTKFPPLKQYVLGIKNWEQAIFATPCINCASIYSFINDPQDFFYGYYQSSILVEIRIKPGSFTEHQSKSLIGRVGGHGKYAVLHNEIYYRISNDKDVVIISIALISSSFLNEMIGKVEDYEESEEVGEVIAKPRKELKELNNLFTNLIF